MSQNKFNGAKTLHSEHIELPQESTRMSRENETFNAAENLAPIITSSTGRRFRICNENDNNDDNDENDNNNNNNNNSNNNDVNNKTTYTNGKDNINGLNKSSNCIKSNSNKNNNTNRDNSVCYDSYGFRVTAREKEALELNDLLINGGSSTFNSKNSSNVTSSTTATMNTSTDANGKVVSGCSSANNKQEKLLNKWCKTLQRWPNVLAAEKKKMCRRGIPRTLRQEAWCKLLDLSNINPDIVITWQATNITNTASALSTQTPTASTTIVINTSRSNNEANMLTILSYRELCNASLAPHELIDVIERDLNRTFPTHRWFDQSNGKGQVMLRRVLRAYANRNPTVGYCQGMGFVAATFLVLFENEEVAFWAFCAIMEAPLYNLQTMYYTGFDELKCKFYVMQKLLKEVEPKVYKKIKSAEVDPSVYATHWFLTLFSYNLNFALLLRIWDMFLCEGWKPIYRIALSFFVLEKLHIVNMKDDGELVKLLMSLHERAIPSQLLSTAEGIKFKTSTIATLEEKYHKKMIKIRKKNKNV